MTIKIKNGLVIPLTGPLTTQIHLRSVCFDREAVTTQINAFLYYDSISRASVIFLLSTAHGLCGFPWAGLSREAHCPLPRERGPFQLGDTSG